MAITPDGPRGPAMTVSIGIVNAARLAQVPIVPITYATSRRRMFPSWDHFHLALPFGRGRLFVGRADRNRYRARRGWARARPIPDRGAYDRNGRRGRPPRRARGKSSSATRREAVFLSPHTGKWPGRGALAAPCRSTGKAALMLPLVYRTLTRPLAPLVLLYLERRRRRGKEDAAAPERTPGFCMRRPTAGAAGVGSCRERRRGDGDAAADRAADRDAARARNPRHHRHGRFGPAARRAAAAADAPSIRAGRPAGLDRALSRSLATGPGALGRIRAVAELGADDACARAFR